MSNKLTGNYMTHRDGGIMYEYEALWTMAAGKIFWDSMVRRDDTVVGTPGGTIAAIPEDSDPVALVRHNVHDAIEAQISTS
jgi:hypothetical protein